MKRARILLGAAHDLVAEGLRGLLGKEHEIVIAVRDRVSLVEAAVASKPDLIVVDLTLAGEKDFEAFRQIRIRLPETRLLGLAGDARIPSPNGLLTGYVAKSARGTEILAAVSRALSRDRQSFSRETPAAGAELTPRQRAVLRMLAQGKSSKEMAHALSISLKTVEFHRANLRALLGVRSTAELTRLAFQLGY